jgi:hypothetical protein
MYVYIERRCGMVGLMHVSSSTMGKHSTSVISFSKVLCLFSFPFIRHCFLGVVRRDEDENEKEEEIEKQVVSQIDIYLIIHASCYPHFLGITKEMMSRGPQVADMEYRETDG